MATLAVMGFVWLTASIYYAGATMIRGPDTVDKLVSFFFSISRAIGDDGIWAGMYNPEQRAGIAYWSNPHFHPLYPLYFNWLGSDTTVVDTWNRLVRINLLHHGILGGGSFFLARILGVRLVPALAVGLVSPWFPTVRSANQWPQILASLAWFPWVFAFQGKIYLRRDARDTWVGVVGLAISASMLVLAQPAQNLMLAVIGSAIVWLAVGLSSPPLRKSSGDVDFRTTSLFLAIAAALALLIVGGYLFEVFRFHGNTIRWLGNGEFLTGYQPIPASVMRLHALPLQDFTSLFAYTAKGGIGHVYIGAAVVGCASSLLFVRTSSYARAMLICGLILMAFCFSPAVALLTTIPLANKVRELTWWSCLAVVILVPVAAAGYQSLFWQLRDGKVRPSVLAAWVVLLCALFALGLYATVADDRFRTQALVALAAGFAVLGWMVLRPPRNPLVLDLGLAIILASVVWAPFHQNRKLDGNRSKLTLADRAQAHTDASRIAALIPDEDHYRIGFGGALLQQKHLPHAYATQGLRSLIGGISPVNHAKFTLLQSPNPAVSVMYGVKYTIVSAADATPRDRRVDDRLFIRTDATALPRLSFVQGGVTSSPAPVDALLAATAAGRIAHFFVDPRDLPADVDIAAYAGGRVTISRPAVSLNRATHLRTRLSVNGPGLLVLNEDPEARWHAKLNERPIPAFRINGFQTAFAIPAAGSYVVEIERPGRLFSYRPAHRSGRR